MRKRIPEMEARKDEWQKRLDDRDEREKKWKESAENEGGFFDDGMEIDSLYDYHETFVDIFEREIASKEQSEDDKEGKQSAAKLIDQEDDPAIEELRQSFL
jgi:hypothetical protein